MFFYFLLSPNLSLLFFLMSSFLNSMNFMVMDSLSFLLCWICFFVFFLSKPMNIEKYFSFILIFFIICFFLSNNMYFMFSFFEMSIIPIFFLIIGWGYQFERLMSSSYLLIYTFFFSLPHLIFLGVFFKKMFSYSIIWKENFYLNIFMLFMLFMAFLIKLPMFFIHGWLPKAHVEAPTIGSIILAALLLKLGSLGFLRFFSMMKFYFFMWVCLLGAMGATFLCFLQSDGKSMIAFSSICHMNILVVSLMVSTIFSKMAASLLMIAHGISSSLMFFFFGILFYSKLSRKIYFLSKIWSVILSISIIMTLFSNFGVPPFLSSVSEIIIMSNIYLFMKNSSVILIVYIIMCGYFSIFLLSVIFFSKKNSKLIFSMSLIFSMLMSSIMMLFFLWMLFFLEKSIKCDLLLLGSLFSSS